MTDTSGPLRVLAVDDEPPALAELAYLLGENVGVGAVSTAASGPDALRLLQSQPVDAVFLDIRMPGLDGLELARVLAQFADPPRVVFVTAYDDYAVDAFDLQACDYVLKPLRPERLAETVRRLTESPAAGAHATGAQPGSPSAGAEPGEMIPVELGGVTRFVARSDVRYAEAHGDYVRLHTGGESHLVRVPLSTLEGRWSEAGFVRIHRRHLVALAHIDELRWEGTRASVRIGDELLPVSRRQTRELRDRLVRGARPAGPGRGRGPVETL